MLKKIILLVVVLVAVYFGFVASSGVLKKSETDKKVTFEATNVEQENESRKTVADLATPCFEKMKLTPEQMKVHNEVMAKIDKLCASIEKQRETKNVETMKINASALTLEEKTEKNSKLIKEINDLNRKHDAIYDKEMLEFEKVLNPEQKKEWDKFQAALAKKFRNYK